MQCYLDALNAYLPINYLVSVYNSYLKKQPEYSMIKTYHITQT